MGSAWSILTLEVNEKDWIEPAIPSIPSHHSNSKVALADKVSGMVAPRPESRLNHLSQTLRLATLRGSWPQKGAISNLHPARFPPFD
jgi:hypothetical protein